MPSKQVIVLYTTASPNPNVMVGTVNTSAASLSIATHSDDSSALTALREANRVRLEAPSFDVKLIRPVETSTADAATNSVPTNWGLEAVGALDSAFDGTDVVAAILDTGIDRSHPAFSGLDIIEEDFTGEGNGDENGHGTHCAGTICGRDVDGTRIGIARGIGRLLVGKVLGRDGGGETGAIADAIVWAIKNGAHVVSMSIGMDYPGYQKTLVLQGRPEEVATSMALEGYRSNVRLFDRLAMLIESGEFLRRRAVVIAATGNESRRNISSAFTIAKAPPAAADGFVSVGAIQRTKDAQRPFKVAPFSNTKADVAAPGVDIWSAKVGGGLVPLSGTSMATPHVAGVAALWAHKSWKENDGDVVIGDVIDNLRFHAKATGLSRDDVGKGIVQAPRE